MPNSSPENVRLLREFLYVDTDKVHALLSQLSGGVPEEARATRRESRSTSVGPRAVQHRSGRDTEDYIQSSLTDANFPELESILEAERILQDLTETLSESSAWRESAWRETSPPGSIIRVTLPGSFFDARYVARQMVAFASVISGLQGMGSMPGRSNTRTQERQARRGEQSPQLEDEIPLFGELPGEDGGTRISREFIQSIVRVARGLFTPGLHLVLYPEDGVEYALTARLEEGRRYLDTEPEILFARYGVDPQQWTLVGIIGHYAEPEDVVTFSSANLVDDNEHVSRIRTARFINSFMKHMGVSGFADLPQYPGFSVIPIAVYRSVEIGREAG